MATRTVPEVGRWLLEQYRAGVGALPGRRLAKAQAGFPAKSAAGGLYPVSGMQRMLQFLRLRLRHPMGRDGYACLVFAVEGWGTRANYAVAYWRRGPGAALEAPPEYVCVSPTYESRDGEYRRRFMPYATYAAACDEFRDVLAPFEAAVLGLVAAGELALAASAHPAEAARAVATADRLRLPVMLLAAALVAELFHYAVGAQPPHLGAAYREFLRRVHAAQPGLTAAWGLREHAARRRLTSGSRVAAFECGQKVVPLALREAMAPHDLGFAAWRELEVSQLASDLVLNFVSPAFPLYNQWTYVEGADETLYENPAMAARLARGRAAARAAGFLGSARRALAAPALAESQHGARLDRRVYKAVEYAQSFLVMSDVALVHTMEHVGVTLGGLPAYVGSQQVMRPEYGAFADLGTAAHYGFSAAHAAHCLHAAGVASTDIHQNNLTYHLLGVMHLQTPDGGFRAVYEAPVTAYVAGPRGEPDAYLFPTLGAYPGLIDYSRAVLGPAFRPRLEDAHTAGGAEHFYRDQVHRVVRAFHRYAPTFVEKHEPALRAAVIANFDAAFPVLCAVDYIAIGRCIRAVAAAGAPAAPGAPAEPAAEPDTAAPEPAAAREPDEKAGGAEGDRPPPAQPRVFRVAPGVAELGRRLEERAREVFVAGLRDLAAAAGSRSQLPAVALPGPALLEQVFGEWRVARWDPARLRAAQLVDAYSCVNELRYSGADYARFPPWARLDELEKHLGGRTVAVLFGRGPAGFLDAVLPGARADVVAERVRAEQDALDGPPPAASSWLDE